MKGFGELLARLINIIASATRRLLLSLLLLAWPTAVLAESPGEKQNLSPCRGAIRTVAVDDKTGMPLVGVTVLVEKTQHGGASDSSGAFAVSGLPCGKYRLRISHVGYETKTVSAAVSAEDDYSVVVRLIESAARVADILVTAPRPYRPDTAITAHAVMTRQELETAPQIANDLYRAVARLPGVETNDFSARFAVRGGDYEEVLVRLDGMELYRPFHIQDIDGGLISIVDIEAVDSVDLMTGAFPAQYGNRLSGVFNLTSRKPPEGTHRQSAGINFLDMRAMSEGVFAGRRGSWLLTARRGYAEYLTPAAVDSEYDLRPVYYDAFARLRYALSDGHTLTAHVLYGEDHFKFVRDRSTTAEGRSRSLYGWLTLESAYGRQLSSSTIVSASEFSHDRASNGWHGYENRRFEVSDSTKFDLWSIQQSWTWAYLDALRVHLGSTLAHQTAAFNYRQTSSVLHGWSTFGAYYWGVRRDMDTSFSSWQSSVFMSTDLRVAEPLTIQAGVRCDHASHVPGTYVDPRFSALLRPANRTVIHVGCGRYHQYQTLDGLAVSDGEQEFSAPEKAVHLVLGIEQNIGRAVVLRAEAYRKSYSHLRARYRSGADQFSPSPQVYEDRIRVNRESALSKGLELRIERSTGGVLAWKLRYTLAKATEYVRSIEWGRLNIPYSACVPSPFDRRHSLNLEVNIRPHPFWQFGLVWQWQSGSPYTGLQIRTDDRLGRTEITPGAVNANCHPSYHRLDVRLDRFWETRAGRVSLFLELLNVYGCKNMRATEYDLEKDRDGHWYMDSTNWYWMPFVPSLGVRWTWEG